MDLQVRQLADGIEVVELAGRLDSASVAAIDGRLSALAATRAARVLVDLSQVSFLASIGIRALLSAARVLRKHGGKMVILSPQPAVGEVLKATAIESMIPVFWERDAASAALQAPSADT
jgi:anti-anti-sigma factor